MRDESAVRIGGSGGLIDISSYSELLRSLIELLRMEFHYLLRRGLLMGFKYWNYMLALPIIVLLDSYLNHADPLVFISIIRLLDIYLNHSGQLLAPRQLVLYQR